VTTPRIRQDLQASPAEEQGIKFFDVHDPRSGSRMRMYDFEWLIAEQMNGSRRLDEVASFARERLGIQPTEADLEAYAKKLAELGFIEDLGAPGRAPEPEPMEMEAEEGEYTPLPQPMPPAFEPPPTPAAVPSLVQKPHPEPTRQDLPTTVDKKPTPAPAPSPVAREQATLAAAAPRTTTTTGSMPVAAAPPKKSSAGSLVAVIAVIVAIAGTVAYMKFGKPQSTHVTVALASPREVVRLYDGAGNVKKAEAQALSFGENGKVTDVVAKGTETKPGMPLATLEQYAQIEKQLADVKDRASFYGKQLEAAKAKGDENAIKTAESKVAEKHKLMTELEARAGKVRLTAPGTGTVSEVLVAPGGEAKAGEPAVKIGDKRMSIDFKVANGPKPGESVTVQPAGGGATIAGKVTAAQNGSVTVELGDDAPVKVGDPLRLVKKKEQNVVPLPAAAVVQRDGADVVFVLSDGEAKLRKVTVVDRSSPNEVLISSGLAAGDSVIVSGAGELQDGQKASTQ
jgi:hypothetical protein